MAVEQQWLAGMEEIDWGKIEHAYGPAVDVPKMIRAIVLNKEKLALKAFGELSNNLNHQGSIYPATGPAVPFLIEALRTTQAGVRVQARLLGLLAGIANGVVTWIIDEITGAMLPGAADDGLGRGVFTAVWQGAGLYTRLLDNDANADVRMQAAHLLGVLATMPSYVPGGLEEVIAALHARVALENDGLVLSSVALALGRVLRYDERVREVLRQLLGRAETDEVARVAAALALVAADRTGHEIPAVDILVDTMCRAAETDLLFQPRIGTGDDNIRWSPWVMGRLRFRLCRALCYWSAGDEGRMARVLPALVVGVRAANGYTAESDIGPVLQWLWPGRDIRITRSSDGSWSRELPPNVTSQELTGNRRTVVEACFQNPEIWNTHVGNTDLVFMRVGLPTSRSEIGKLISAPELRR